jgi:hypothetical protein
MLPSESRASLIDPAIGTAFALCGVTAIVALIETRFPHWPGVDSGGKLTSPDVILVLFVAWVVIATGTLIAHKKYPSVIGHECCRTALTMSAVAGYEVCVAFIGCPWITRLVNHGQWSAWHELGVGLLQCTIPAAIVTLVWSRRPVHSRTVWSWDVFVVALIGTLLGLFVLSRDVLYFWVDLAGLLHPGGQLRPPHLWVVKQPWTWSLFAIIGSAPVSVQLYMFAIALRQAYRRDEGNGRCTEPAKAMSPKPNSSERDER